MSKKYEKIRLLGKGAHGKCYLARDQEGKLVALKQTDMKHLKTEEKADAVKEGKLLEAFSHPFIIKFRDVYRTTKDKLCVVMDFAEGGDLKTAIDKQNGAKFDENTILDWFVQICCALKHVHDRKVLHRDIKSQNIFLDASRKVKLGDFGIAKTLDDTFDMATSVVGTPYYLSPEIVNSKPYSFKSDIWALGVVLYEMCELRPPFMATSLHGLVMKINSGDYAPISEQFSVSLDNLIQALLTNDPELRPNINQILQLPYIQHRIAQHLAEDVHREEFSHTIIHDSNVFEVAQKRAAEEEARKQSETGDDNFRGDLTEDEVLKKVLEGSGEAFSPHPPLRDMMNDEVRSDSGQESDNDDELEAAMQQPEQVPQAPPQQLNENSVDALARLERQTSELATKRESLVKELGQELFDDIFYQLREIGLEQLSAQEPSVYAAFFEGLADTALLERLVPEIVNLIILEASI